MRHATPRSGLLNRGLHGLLAQAELQQKERDRLDRPCGGLVA